MSQPKKDDLSDLLNEIAESQQRQEEELKELSGATHNPPPLEFADDPIDAILADETAQTIAPPVMEPAVDENAIATERIEQTAQREERAAHDLSDLAQTAHPDPTDELAHLAEDAAASKEIDADGFPPVATTDVADDLAAALSGEIAGGEEARSASPVSLGGASGVPREMPTPQPARRAASRPRAKAGGGMAAVFAPVMITLGTLMLFPAVWAVLILMGKKVWLHNGKDVDTMAKIMLTCWPVGLGLIAGGVFALIQISRAKAKQRGDDAGRPSREA